MPESNAYATLGLNKGASDKDVKNAYVSLVKKWDPEKHTDRFMVIQKAYDRLRDTRLRAREDVFTFNLAKGEFLFQDDERFPGEGAPDEVTISKARVAHHEDPMDEDKKQAFRRLLFQRAHYSIQHRKLGEAIRDWTEILEIEPSNIRARHNLELASASLGLSYALHGLHEESIELFEQALKLNPDNTEVIHNLALVSEKAEKWEKAAKYWGEVVSRWRARLDEDPENEYLRHCVIEAINHYGEYTDYEEARNRAQTESHPSGTPDTTRRQSPGSSPKARAQAVLSHARGNKTEKKKPSVSSKSLERFREIVKLNPEDFDTHFRLCNKLMEDQQFGEACTELRELSKKHPKNTEVLNLLGWALLNNGEKDAAFQCWNRSLAADPRNPGTREHLVRAHRIMGRSYRSKGLFTPALVHFKQLLSLTPRDPEARLEIAATYDMKGDVRSAMQEYNQVLTLDPKNKVARKAVNDLRMKR